MGIIYTPTKVQGFEKLLVQKLCELLLSQIMEKYLESVRDIMEILFNMLPFARNFLSRVCASCVKT